MLALGCTAGVSALGLPPTPLYFLLSSLVSLWAHNCYRELQGLELRLGSGRGALGPFSGDTVILICSFAQQVLSKWKHLLSKGKPVLTPSQPPEGQADVRDKATHISLLSGYVLARREG